MRELKLKFHPIYEDYLTVNKATTFNKPSLILLGLMGIMTVYTITGLAVGWINVDPSLIILYLLPPGMFIVFLIYTPFNLRKKAQEMADQDLTIQWQINAEGIRVEKNGEQKIHKWESLGVTQELDEHFIIFFKANRSKYIFLPKKALSDPDDEKHFRKWLTKKIGQIK